MTALESAVALLTLPEGTQIIDASGRVYEKFSSGRETANTNWICWVSGDEKFRTNEIQLPAEVVSPEVDFNSPLPATTETRFASILRELLRSLDRQVVLSALVGEGEGDLLDAEREEVQRLGKFLDGRVLTGLVLDGRRGGALRVLDAFEDEVLAAHSVHGSPLVGSSTVSGVTK